MTATQSPRAPTESTEVQVPEAVRTAVLRDRLVAHIHHLDQDALRTLAEQLGLDERILEAAPPAQETLPSSGADIVPEAIPTDTPMTTDPFPPGERMTMEAYVAELEEGSAAVRRGEFVTLAELRQSLIKYR